MNRTIKCRCCGVEKPEDNFYLRKDAGRRRTDCKGCFNTRVLERAKAKPEQRRATQQAYVDRNRDAVRSRNSAHKKANRARINAEQAARRARQPEKERGYRDALLHSCGKQGRSWEGLVGYTSANLRTHLEQQFLPGMSWENMSDWEIDHIVALADFNIRDAGDAEFRAAWSLGNLRPLWRSHNRAKSSRRMFLL